MYTWSGDVDLNFGNASDVVMTGQPPDGVVSGAEWIVKIRVHSNAVDAAKTSITIYNGDDWLYSEQFPAVSYEIDPSWPEWRRIATFSGTFSPPLDGSFSDWFNGVSSCSLWRVDTDNSAIPGGIAEIVYAEVVPLTGETPSGNAWEAVMYNNGQWEEQDVIFWGGRWEEYEPSYISEDGIYLRSGEKHA